MFGWVSKTAAPLKLPCAILGSDTVHLLIFANCSLKQKWRELMPGRSNQAGSLCSESSGGRFAGCCHTPENSYINVSEPVNSGLFSQPVWLINELLLSAYVGEFQGPLCHHKAVAVGADCGWRLEQNQHALFNRDDLTSALITGGERSERPSPDCKMVQWNV